MDFLGPMPLTDKKFHYIFVIIDNLTKYCWLYCTKYLSTADAIAILEKHYTDFGHPKQIITHRHYALESIELKYYCIRNGIDYLRLQNDKLQGYGSERLLFERISSLLFDVAKNYRKEWYTKLRSIEKLVNKSAATDAIRCGE